MAASDKTGESRPPLFGRQRERSVVERRGKLQEGGKGSRFEPRSTIGRDLANKAIRILRAFFRRKASHLSRDDIDDLVQETLCRALTVNPAQLRGPFLNYALGIAEHVFVDTLRAKARMVGSNERKLNELPDGNSPTEGSLVGKVFLESVLLRESEELRKLFLRRICLDESRREAAVALCISNRRVRTLETHLQALLGVDDEEKEKIKSHNDRQKDPSRTTTRSQRPTSNLGTNPK